MTDLKEWLAALPQIKLAFAMLCTGLAGTFMLGAATVGITRIPAAVAFNQEQIDTINAKAQITVLRWMDLSQTLDRHIEQDSLATAEIICVLRALHDGETVGPYDCPKERSPQ